MIKDGRSVEKVCTSSTNFSLFLGPPIQYQHRFLLCFLSFAPCDTFFQISDADDVISRVGHSIIVCFFQPYVAGQAVQQSMLWNSSSRHLAWPAHG